MKNIVYAFIILLSGLLTTNTSFAYDLSGQVLYQGDPLRPVNNVTVLLTNIGNNTIQSYVTGGDGFYQFTNVPNGNYKLTGATSLPGGGVTYYDAAMVFLHIIGYYQFTPIQFLASDVNGTGSINWTDYNLIVYHLLYNTPFPVGPWRFESSTFTITNLKDGVPHGLGGTCSGDIGGTFVPTINTTPALPLAQEGSVSISKNEPFTTRILTQQEMSITGAGMLINYPTNLLEIESVEFKGADYKYNIENGQIRLVWGNPSTAAMNFSKGETFITIHGYSTTSFDKGMTATLSLDGNTSLINASNQEVSNLKFASPVIKYHNPAVRFSNFPNPFTTSTMLNIYCPTEGEATIGIYNAGGQMVKNINVGTVNAGLHEVLLDASQMAPGYYLCKLHIQAGSNETENTIKLLKTK